MAKTKKIPFFKIESSGGGNIVFDGLTRAKPPSPNRLAKRLCNPHTGIGGDRLILLSKSRKADFKIEVYNADSSASDISGGGLCAAARHIRNMNYTGKKSFKIETQAGIHEVKVNAKTVDVRLGEPRLKGKEIPVNLSGRIINRPLKIETKDFRVTCLSFGNPHCIIFQESLDHFPVEKFGPLLENYHVFPKRVNVSFVNVISNSELSIQVWERGVGKSQASATAACASLVASVLNGYAGRKARVTMPGGKVQVEWEKNSNQVIFTASAQTLFEGQLWI